MIHRSSTVSNPNAAWVDARGIWIAYVALIIVIRTVIGLSLDMINMWSVELSWTGTSVLHTLITFIFLHSSKGTPFEENQGKYQGLTTWEQLDNGEQLTNTRKFFTIVPVILFLITLQYIHSSLIFLLINLSALGLAVIPKLPAMHKVRLFGLMRY